MTQAAPQFIVEAIEDVVLAQRGRLAGMYVLSPFVWREGDRYHLMVRGVPSRDDEPRLKMAEVWYGTSTDGLNFEMHEAPTLWGGPDEADLDGCEDPTVFRSDDRYWAWYTGWNQAQETGRLMLASGTAPDRMEKQGIALDTAADFVNPKEATVARAESGAWTLFFEYAAHEASIIGRAIADEARGPWRNKSMFLDARPNRWDNWHLSTGPIVEIAPGRPVMFYNGATRDAHWRIGWVELDADLTRIVARGDDPLITPDVLGEGWTDIAFAASADRHDETISLWFSIADRQIKRARIRVAAGDG